MQLKSDTRGITLVELVVAVALLSVVLSCAYFLLVFSTKSFKDTEAKFNAQQDARMCMIYMEEDIRKAKSVNIDGDAHPAVEILDSGLTMIVYTDTNNDGALELVQYKVEDHQFKRTVAALKEELGTGLTLAHKVINDMISPNISAFKVDNAVITVNLLLMDEKELLTDNPISVNTSIKVRSKGAMF